MRRLKVGMGFVSIAFGGALAFSAAGGAEPPAGAQLPARTEMTLDGPILVTTAGMSLYAGNNENVRAEKFKWQCTGTPPAIMNDQQSGIGERPAIGFKLLRSCTQKFPPYLADAAAKPVGDFSIVDRPEGGRQWVYKGSPLYTSINDVKPGDRNGLSLGGFISGGVGRVAMRLAAAPVDLPAGVKFANTDDGAILASTVTNRPFYTPRGRASVVQASVGPNAFQPLLAPTIARSSGNDWSVVDAGPGRKQYAYKGRPLYAAPAGIQDYEIAEAGGWDPVVAFKAPPRPAEIGKHLSLLGDVYTDRKGMTLYIYACIANGGGGGPRLTPVACDAPGDPAAWMVTLCGDGKECARRWRPYLARGNARPSGDWSIVDITYPMFTDMRGALYPADAPKVKAWAYRGRPVFTYYEDEAPGDIWGDGVKGIWGSGFTALQVPGKSAIFE